MVFDAGATAAGQDDQDVSNPSPRNPAVYYPEHRELSRRSINPCDLNNFVGSNRKLLLILKTQHIKVDVDYFVPTPDSLLTRY